MGNPFSKQWEPEEPTQYFKRLQGVAFYEKTKKWQAIIGADGKSNHLGYFETEREATEAHNAATAKHFGVYAKLNEFTV